MVHSLRDFRRTYCVVPHIHREMIAVYHVPTNSQKIHHVSVVLLCSTDDRTDNTVDEHACRFVRVCTEARAGAKQRSHRNQGRKKQTNSRKLLQLKLNGNGIRCGLMLVPWATSTSVDKARECAYCRFIGWNARCSNREEKWIAKRRCHSIFVLQFRWRQAASGRRVERMDELRRNYWKRAPFVRRINFAMNPISELLHKTCARFHISHLCNVISSPAPIGMISTYFEAFLSK